MKTLKYLQGKGYSIVRRNIRTTHTHTCTHVHTHTQPFKQKPYIISTQLSIESTNSEYLACQHSLLHFPPGIFIPLSFNISLGKECKSLPPNDILMSNAFSDNKTASSLPAILAEGHSDDISISQSNHNDFTKF